MRLAEIIARLKTVGTLFGGRVFCAAEFASAREGEGDVTKPSAYVVPLAEEANREALAIGQKLELVQRFAVFVVLAPVDDRGTDAAINATTIYRMQLMAALRNWVPASDCDDAGILYVGGEIEQSDRAVLWWRFDFEMRQVFEQ